MIKKQPLRINVNVSTELLAQLNAAYNAAGRSKDRPARDMIAGLILQVGGALNRAPTVGVLSQRPADPE